MIDSPPAHLDLYYAVLDDALLNLSREPDGDLPDVRIPPHGFV